MKVISTTTPTKNEDVSLPFECGEDGIYIAQRDFSFVAYCDIDGKKGNLWFNVFKGCKYNGASNPLNWPIENYYGNAKKDICGLGHDILYAFGGEVKGLGRKLKAGECDDYIRGSMREAGFTRKEAGIVDRAVRWFAHFNHFGKKYDKEDMHNNSEVVWVPMVVTYNYRKEI